MTAHLIEVPLRVVLLLQRHHRRVRLLQYARAQNPKPLQERLRLSRRRRPPIVHHRLQPIDELMRIKFVLTTTRGRKSVRRGGEGGEEMAGGRGGGGGYS